MMKRITGFLLMLVMIMSTCAVSVGAENYEEVDIYINDRLLQTDQPAIIFNGRTLVPIRAICVALGCEVQWYDELQTAQIENELVKMSITIGKYSIKKIDRENPSKQEERDLDVPAVIYNDRTLVPARAISEALHAQVDWNNERRCVEITMEYDLIWDFEDGYALVEKDGKRGMINENRKLVVPVEYNQVIGFKEGCTTVILDGKEGMVDITGKEVLPCEYETVSIVFDGYATVKKDGKWGSVDTKGNIVVPCIYDEKVVFMVNTTMSHLKNRARVVRDGKWGYVNTEGKEIIPCVYETSTAALEALMGI